MGKDRRMPNRLVRAIVVFLAIATLVAIGVAAYISHAVTTFYQQKQDRNREQLANPGNQDME
jgi:phage shock protein PspC (stress-responsive transcriptional regulator)